MIYDERSRLVLWDYIPNKESRKDIINAMKVNLGKKNPTMIKEFSFSINTPYEKTVTGTGPYKTAFSYTLLPNFIGDSQSAAQAWASRNGVKVTFKGTSGHVIAQSYPANKRADLVSGSVVLTLSGGSSSTTSNSSTTTDNKNTTKDKDTTTKNNSNNNDSSKVETDEDKTGGISGDKDNTNSGDGSTGNGGGETPPEKDKVPSE